MEPLIYNNNWGNQIFIFISELPLNTHNTKHNLYKIIPLSKPIRFEINVLFYPILWKYSFLLLHIFFIAIRINSYLHLPKKCYVGSFYTQLPFQFQNYLNCSSNNFFLISRDSNLERIGPKEELSVLTLWLFRMSQERTQVRR